MQIIDLGLPGQRAKVWWVTTELRYPIFGKEIMNHESLQISGRRMRSLVVRIAAVVVLTIGGVGTLSTPAAADVGDGNLACSVGEICFKKHNDGNYLDYIKHFWYGADHGGYSWGGRSGASGGAVQFEASMYWNRDTQCTVYMSDASGTTYRMAPQSASGYSYFGWLWNDANFSHQRCSPNAPWGT